MCEVWGRGWGLLFSICLSSCSRLTYWKTDLSVSNHFGAFVKNLLTMYGSVFVLSLFCSFYVCLNSLSFYLPLNILQHIDWKAVHVPRSVLVGHSEVYLSLSYLCEIFKYLLSALLLFLGFCFVLLCNLVRMGFKYKIHVDLFSP